MTTVSSMAERLEISAEDAVEKLRYMLVDVSNAKDTITDEECDLLIDAVDDPTLAEETREAKLKSIEVEKQKAEKKRAAATKKKATAERKAAAAEKKAATAKKKASASKKKASTKKATPKKKAAAKKKAPAKKKGAGKVAEILGVDATEEKLGAAPAAVTPKKRAKPVAEILPPETEEEKRQKAEAKEEPALVIGSAIDHESNVVEVVRADGTHMGAPQVEDLVVDDQASVKKDDDALGSLAEAERRQGEEVARRQRRKEVPKPDAAVVADVIRKDEKRKEKTAPPRPFREAGRHGTPPRRGPTGKTARKKQKKAERARAEEVMRRDAAAMVREYQAGALDGGSKKRRKKRREEGGEVEGSGAPMILEVEEGVTVERLADQMEVEVNEIILELMDYNILATKNQALSLDVVKKIAESNDYEVRAIIPEEEEILREEEDDPESLTIRAPVITVMGHVDHGKTSLLDHVRKANVAEGEAGGITQHIAAYDVPFGDGRVVFLDTPGHEAFTQMRARGAQVTDVVVLVVAADDGVQPQTIEAIDHARAAEVPIVVAVNKCDKAGAEPDRIRQELTKYDLVDEQWGGKTVIRNISAKTGDGVDELMELLVLESDMLELKANANKRARGAIIESEITVGLGPVAWVLIQSGTLKVGDVFLAGETYGRVRTMQNSRGQNVTEAGPSTPVVVTGFSSPPDAGDQFAAVNDERVARSVAEKRSALSRQKQAPVRHITLEDFHEQMLAGERKELNIVLKADVQGSVDVLRESLSKVGNEEVHANIVHSGVGGVNESDILLASASEAVIIGFHVTANTKVQKMAEREGVDVRTYRIIYEAIEAVRKALEGMLTPDSKEVVTGHAEIRAVFRSSAIGNIAGCMVLDGEISRGSQARLLRDGVIIHEGRIGTLRREKDDARTVSEGFECGITLDRYGDIKVNDVVEVFRIEDVAKTLA